MQENTLLIVMVLCLLVLVGCIYFTIRNDWVYKNRVKQIAGGNYGRLESYEYMLWKKPFCWDIKKFIKDYVMED